MKEIALTALKASHPLGFLAAVGTLRLIPGAALAWQVHPSGEATAVLHSALGEDELVDLLCSTGVERSRSLELNWSDKIDDVEFPKALLKARAEENWEAIDFLVALASVTGAERSPWDMTAGQLKFLREIRSINSQLTVDQVREAIFGPWEFSQGGSSLGLDPSRERLHAHEAVAPASVKTKRVAAAVSLAFEALPLFPLVGPKAAVGWRKIRRFEEPSFTWPVWKSPATFDTVRGLVALKELQEETPRRPNLGRYGIVQAYRCVRRRAGRYGQLSPAMAVA